MQTALVEAQNAQTAITPENYAFLQQYLHRESGIVLDAGKHYLIESRLLPLVRQENLSTLNDLCGLIRTNASLQLRCQVVESMTTNETLFFRDVAFFDALQKQVLPQLIASRSSIRRLNIWSAAASSGQEAYSLSILLKEMGLEG